MHFEFKHKRNHGVVLGLALVLSACGYPHAESTQVPKVSAKCSITRSQDHIVVNEWVANQKLLIGIGILHCDESATASLDFSLDSNAAMTSTFELIPYVKDQAIGVIPVEKSPQSMNEGTRLESLNEFIAPAGDSQILAILSVPKPKPSRNQFFAEFQVHPLPVRSQFNDFANFTGGIDYFINFVD